jgi:hypothetical protein
MGCRTSYLFPVLLLVTIAAAQSEHPSEPPSPSARNTAQDLTPEQRAKIEQLAKLQKHFGKDMSSSGVELSLKEIVRSHAEDRTLVKYDLYASGFLPKTSFTLYQVQLDGSVVKTLERVTLTNQGLAICGGTGDMCQNSGPDDPVELIVYAGKGEPKRFGLVSDDETHAKGFVSVVPFPNSTSDKGCSLESIIGTPNGEVTYIQGSGFDSNAELTIDGESYGEKHHDLGKAQADGSYFLTLMPYIVGKNSGKTNIEVKSKKCSPKLTFEWGTYHLE